MGHPGHWKGKAGDFASSDAAFTPMAYPDKRPAPVREILTMDENSGIGTAVTGIRCRIGRAEVALPLGEVGQIIEYSVFPLPLARRWIGGLGLHEDRPLVSVALARLPDRVRGQQRKAQGILLQGHGFYQVDWALEQIAATLTQDFA